MRHLLAASLLAVAFPAFAGDIDMGLTNPGPVKVGKAANAMEALKALDSALGQASQASVDLDAVLASAQATLKSATKEANLDYRAQYLKKIENDCRSGFRPSDVAVAATAIEHRAPVSRFLACQALVAGGHAPCTASPAYSTKARPDVLDTSASSCIDAYYVMRFADAKLGGGDAAGVCAKATAARGGSSQSCASVVAGKCDAIRAMPWQPFDGEAHCAAVQAAIAGGPAACKAKGETFGYDCSDVAALRAARKGGTCGASALCAAAVTGKVDACLPLLSVVSENYCNNLVKTKSKTESALLDAAAREWRDKNPHPRTAAMNSVVEKRKSVDALLVSIGTTIEGFEPKTAPGFPARVTRYKEIRRKVDGALKKFAQATNPKPAPKPGQ